MNEALKKTLYAGLQYGLRVWREGDNKARLINTGTGTSTNWVGIKTALRYPFKPILFSLDQLTKPITIGGETKCLIDEIFIRYGGGVSSIRAKKRLKETYADNIMYSPIGSIKYDIVEILVENHFNVFRLKEGEYIPAETGNYY